MTDTTPHLSELLDLTTVIDEATVAYVAKTGGLTPDQARETIAAARVVDRQELRSIVLATVYAGARAIAEQAYAQAWDRAHLCVDQWSGDADDVLGTLDQHDDELPDGAIAEPNPFGEGWVIV